MRSNPQKFWPLLGLLVFLVSGCETAVVSHPVVNDLAANDDDTQIEFWHTLATKSVCCNDDAFHALLLDLDGTDPNPDYQHRVAALKSRQLLLPGFDKPAHDAVTRGVVAVALYKAGNIHGGFVLTVFGPSERYCLRELQYDNLLPPSSPNQTFSGLELVGVIGRFEDYLRGNPADLPADEMPPPAPNFRGNPQLLKQPAVTKS